MGATAFSSGGIKAVAPTGSALGVRFADARGRTTSVVAEAKAVVQAVPVGTDRFYSKVECSTSQRLDISGGLA